MVAPLSAECVFYIPNGEKQEEYSHESLQYLETFFQFLYSEKNYSEHTIRAYLKDLLEFLAFLGTEDRHVGEVDIIDLRSFFTMRTGVNFSSKNRDQHAITGKSRNRKLNPRTQARKLAAIRCFFRLLYRREMIAQNPTATLSAPKQYRPLPERVKFRELDLIFAENKNANSNQTFHRDNFFIRDLAIYEMLYSTGMRISELLSISVSQIPADTSTLRIVGKGQKERMVFLGKPARTILQKYLTIRNDFNPKTEKLFLNHRGGALSDRGVRFRMREYQRKIGLENSLSPHKFRHSFATDMLNAGADIRVVQELLGHSSLSTTQIYTGVTMDRLQETYMNSHPHSFDSI